MYKFADEVATREDLRKILGDAGPRVVAKVLTRLDHHCRTFIERCPFLLVASSNVEGAFDISPKGDPVGFVQILDDHTLLIPERPGNRRADTFENVLRQPAVGLIFPIPGKRETLRISGKARIVKNGDLMKEMAVDGKAPKIALAVHVEEAFFHCAKCMIRSNLWNIEAWPSLNGLPSLAETMVDAGRLDESVEEMQNIVDGDEQTFLY